MPSCVESSRTPSNRYPILSVNGRLVGEHRHVWAQANGPIPDGMVVRHSCDNTRCINPDHLLLGTQAENLADMDDRGRRVSWNDLKTGCANGHGEYDRIVSGRRICSTCRREKKRAWKARVAA